MTETEYSRKMKAAEELADRAWFRGGLEAMQEELASLTKPPPHRLFRDCTTYTDDKGDDWHVQHNGFAASGKVRVEGPHGAFTIPAFVMLDYAASARTEKPAATKDIAPLIEQALKAILEARGEFNAALTEAQKLVREAHKQHTSGDLDSARDSAMDAGDLLHDWVGDSEAVGALEEALWEGEDDAWEKHREARGSRD